MPINDTYPLTPKKMLKITQESFGIKLAYPYFCTPKTERQREQVDLVAQLVEHNTFNVGALGSSPSGITDIKALT
jgi:hypothetical protein